MVKWLVAAFLSLIPTVILAQQPAVAFFYGDNPPMNELRVFDWVVVEPGHLPDPKPHQHHDSEVFAYVSLGEVSPDRGYLKEMPEKWLTGENKGWNSRVIDQTSEGWAEFAVEKLFAPLWQAGYRGFFLDTLDSFNLIAKTDAQRHAQAQGLAKVIAAVKRRFPTAKLIFNRGFEILPMAMQYADAVAFESWISGYNADTKGYRDVPQADRDWLGAQLAQVKANNIPIISIDYVAPENRDKARTVAQGLKEAGFIPWVANPELNLLGVGAIEVMPRRVLMVTKPVPDEYDYHFSTEITYTTAILNAMGYAVDYAPINRNLIAQPVAGRYTGVIVMLEEEANSKDAKSFPEWLVFIKKQVPTLLLGDVSYLKNKLIAQAFGLQLGEAATVKSIQVDKQSPKVGFEKNPDFERLGFFTLTSKQAVDEWLTFKADGGRKQIAIGITEWGAFGVAPNLFATGLSEVGYADWLVDPYALFEKGLKLKPMPLPDTTTESGRRLLMVHHDGDGFASRAEMPGNPYASRVILDEIVKKYPLPMTMSVIEGETSTTGLYPKDSAALEKIAREMFAQPNVEIASHTYSHPFSWAVVAGARKESDLYGSYNLEIPNYKPSIPREVLGSVDYINTRLAPKNKKVKIIHWSGDCNPGKDALGLAEQLGIASVNGGETKMTRSHDTLTKVGPVGIDKDGIFQVYAPNQNENVYTNDWTGPFYGFERSIETHQLTESPRRIKPVDIYFHTYLGTKKEGLDALKKVFDWAMVQPLHPVVMSDYVRKAEDFHKIVVAREGDAWRVRGLDHLQALRIPQSMGYPDLLAGSNIAGFNDFQEMRYLHVVGNETRFSLKDTAPTVPYLVDANAAIKQFERTPSGFRIQLSGHVPLAFSINATNNCQVTSHEAISADAITSNVRKFRSRHAAATIEALCRS
jgi:hypothetical protein